MIANTGHVMTLANSIIGVGILAMPFCFQKCGIVLSICLLVINNFITRISCHYLIKSSILTRRKSFEFLGFHAFGSSGKLMVELCTIGYLIGTCIAYFVVVGDVGPQITAKVLNIPETEKLRTWVMVIVTVLCIIPLGLLKNVDSLSVVCTASIGFYFCLVMKVIAESMGNFMSNDWTQYVEYWRPAGILQCLPIFSMALSCQMQLFEVQETIPNVTIDKMNGIVKNATAICTYVYIFVGFFGYVAFCKQPFSGNILVDFSPSFGSDAIKMGFVLSVAFSFPLVIFPCRASIYSLLYRRGHVDASPYIPETRFKFITISIAVFSLILGLLIPSIELVIGLVGSTIGVAICIMFPASCFMKVIKKDSTEKLLAQFILIGGFCLMILGTYANLNAIDEKRSGPSVKGETKKIDNKILEIATKFENLSDPRYLQQQNVQVGKENDVIVSVNLPEHLNKNENHHKVLTETIVHEISNDIVKNLKAEKQGPQEAVRKKNQDIVGKKIFKPSVAAPIQPSFTGSGINKDAIKKEEEVVAEEEQKDTNNELEKTKELFEKKVNELKEELAKRNKETENLVHDKLEEFAEKVEKIEREAHQDAKSSESPKLPVVEKQKNIDVNTIQTKNISILESNLDENIKKVEMNLKKNVETQLDNSIVKDTLKSYAVENKVKTDNSEPIHKNNKTENNIIPVTSVYEPKSYQVGEKMNQVAEAKKKNILPLPLLLNTSFQKIIPSVNQVNVKQDIKIDLNKPYIEKSPMDTVESELKERKNEQKKEEVNDHKKEETNVEPRHRDLLEVITEEVSATTLQPNPRVKRSASKEVCNESNVQIQNCLDKNIMNVEIKNLIDTKTLIFGRDLKSIQETVRE